MWLLVCILFYSVLSEGCLKSKIKEIQYNEEQYSHIGDFYSLVLIDELCSHHNKECLHILYEIFFNCVLKYYPKDWTLKLAIAKLHNNHTAIFESLTNGAYVNIYDYYLFTHYSYQRKIINNCFIPWKHLYHLLVKYYSNK